MRTSIAVHPPIQGDTVGTYKTDTMSLMQDIRPRYLTPQQAAAYCNYSLSYLEKLRKSGCGPAYTQRTRKDIRYDVSDIDAWMQRDKIQTIDSISLS